jgi:hypothetical protein
VPVSFISGLCNFRGFGFVRMKDPAGRSQSLLFGLLPVIFYSLAVDVIMSNDHIIDGKLVDVKRALPRSQTLTVPERERLASLFLCVVYRS